MREAFRGRFNQALNAAMQRANITADLAFAESLRAQGYKIRQQDLSAWRKGRVPDINRMPMIGEALGVSWQWLLVGDEAAAASASVPLGRAPTPGKRPSRPTKKSPGRRAV